MRISASYSHMNGEEYLLVHRKEVWEEVKNIIADVDAEECKPKISAEERHPGKLLYAQTDMIREAEISDCGRYRYTLSRRWDRSKPAVMFIMLNPSTADARQDDPTITRCIAYAKAWDYGELLVGNLFAWRSPRPDSLLSTPDPVGPRNNTALLEMAQRASKIIAAWGNHGGLKDRSQSVRRMFPGRLYALDINSSGEPTHPRALQGITCPFPLK